MAHNLKFKQFNKTGKILNKRVSYHQVDSIRINEFNFNFLKN